ncbi:V-type proton ATPase subunit S1-like [Watersipora subatra]|uniref:V-type proton ATPase subunit S1-like n=1 Tax=Watersipora subatra TaxID=2589382 RepID=UPI00355C1AEE
MSLRLVFCVVAALFPCLAIANVGPPVYMFRDERVELSIAKPLAGQTIQNSEFSSQLSTIKSSDLMITFLQDELSNEDFLRLDNRMRKGQLFKNVQRYSDLKTSIYWPAVKAPAQSLGKMSSGYVEKVEVSDGRKAAEYFDKTGLSSGTFIVISLLPTSGENSSAAIKANDEIIGEVMNIVEKSGLTYTAFFTAINHRRLHETAVVQGVGRHLLAETTTPSPPADVGVFFYSNEDCMVYISQMKLDKVVVEKAPVISCTVEKDPGTLETVTITADNINIVMTFVEDGLGGWMMNGTTVNDASTSVPRISAPLQFSYHCSTELTWAKISNSSATLTIQTLQIQVFDFKVAAKFGLPYDCVGFFTIPIWTGLIASFLLIAVTTYGLYMLSSIQTFDRYDDPKSKPLTVTISE